MNVVHTTMANFTNVNRLIISLLHYKLQMCIDLLL